MRVGLFVPCFVDALYPGVAVATLRLLERLGVTVDYPTEQTCCGQPHFNAGRRGEARKLASRFATLFADYDAVVSPSGSCTAMVRNHYPELIGANPVCERTYELCQFLVDRLGVTELGARLPGRAALHIGCHQRRELGAGAAVTALIEKVADLTVVPIDSDPWCCGFGGTFAVKFPELSTAMAHRKLDPMLAEQVDYLISTDSSCLMHLSGVLSRDRRLRPRPLHIAEVLAGEVEGAAR